jgi:hypothetical protein
MQAHFEKLRQNLEPNPTFSEIIRTRHAAVRAQLAPNSHLIGSLQRKTRIQPLAGQTFDIDILVILGDFITWAPVGGITSSAAIQHVLTKALESDRYAVKNPVADAPTVTLHFSNEVKVELVPAYLDNIGRSPSSILHSPKGRAYWVPNGTGGWMLADYDYDAEYMSGANERSDSFLVPVIKMLKAIKRMHFPQLKSYALEILAAAHIPAIVSAFRARGLSITYPVLLKHFFLHAKADLGNLIVIPGSLSAPIILTSEVISQAGERFDAIGAAIAQIEALSDAQKVGYWRAIVGDPFPATL